MPSQHKRRTLGIYPCIDTTPKMQWTCASEFAKVHASSASFRVSPSDRMFGNLVRMKSIKPLLVLPVALLVLSGCSKQEAETSSTVPQPPTEADVKATANDLKQAVEKQADAVKQAAAETARQAQAEAQRAADQAKAAADQAANQAQSVIDQAKGYVSDKRYQDALATLKQLSNSKLTPDQEKMVNDLKTQIQTLMSNQLSTNAASAIGGFLKK